VAPSIPLPVQAIPRKPTLQQRAKRIDQRLTKQSEDFLRRYQENFDMSWIYHDAALEGVVYTYAELTAALQGGEPNAAVDSSVAPIFDAIQRQKAAIDYVRNVAARKRTPINVEMVKQLYTILHPEEGDTKSVKYRRDVPQHRLYFHEYAAPDKVTYRVRQVVDWLNDPETRKKVGTLRMAAKAHYDLARTYPFPVDSGKVARLFMNVLLMRGGLPPAIIHATERQRYYEALKSASPSVIVSMLRDSVENSMASIEKLLDEFETRKRAFVS
jgi:Fic family protein